LKGSVAIAERYRSCIRQVVDGGKVQNAIAIKVTEHNRNRQAANVVSLRRLKSTIAVPEKESDGAILAHRDQIENPVVVAISGNDSAGEIPSRIRDWRLGLAIRLAQENSHRTRTEHCVRRGNIRKAVAIEVSNNRLHRRTRRIGYERLAKTVRNSFRIERRGAEISIRRNVAAVHRFCGRRQSETAHARREIVILGILTVRLGRKHGGATCFSSYLQRYEFGSHQLRRGRRSSVDRRRRVVPPVAAFLLVVTVAANLPRKGKVNHPKMEIARD
jgi:hypothetical protein